ncbi:MAG: SDR family oxidoreductase [Phycisphaeraceae bacterium]|nr:MAG: SDR family oxidoreductase [Phycisphaeraceae bacterium]
MGDLTDTVAIVTGASSGIGAATAVELGKRGVRVACAARRRDRLEELVGRIVGEGGAALAVECDVADRGSVEALVDRTLETWGRVDTIVNNAGVMPLSMMVDGRVEDWERMVDVNIKGVLYGVAAVLPSMLERGSGHIVNVSSIAGRRVFNGGAVYCGTKFAVHAITEGLRQELASKNIRVTCIAPGLVGTELQHGIPVEELRENVLKRMRENPPLTSEDVAAAIVYAMEAPANVGVNEVVLRPVWQEP